MLRDLRRIEKRQGDRYFNVVELNKSLWELGRALKWKVNLDDLYKVRRGLKKVKNQLEAGVEDIGGAISSARDCSPWAAVLFCRFASAVELVKELTSSTVLKNNDFFEFGSIMFLVFKTASISKPSA